MKVSPPTYKAPNMYGTLTLLESEVSIAPFQLTDASIQLDLNFTTAESSHNGYRFGNGDYQAYATPNHDPLANT
jgi:hypothetical protein